MLETSFHHKGCPAVHLNRQERLELENYMIPSVLPLLPFPPVSQFRLWPYITMHLSTLLVGIATVTSLGCCIPIAYTEHHLHVKTDSGVLCGYIDAVAPNVRQFLGIPFAEAPSGPKRWLPPTRRQSSALFNAKNIGPGCPQNLPDDLTKASVYSPGHGNQTEYFPPQDFSEDCLTLNIWTS
jgi:hypothetical protein